MIEVVPRDKFRVFHALPSLVIRYFLRTGK